MAPELLSHRSQLPLKGVAVSTDGAGRTPGRAGLPELGLEVGDSRLGGGFALFEIGDLDVELHDDVAVAVARVAFRGEESLEPLDLFVLELPL